jgi:hypothetical protein
MPQLERGDIVVERLTGTRVIVISARQAADDVTVRFPDGRLEDRYAFELEQPQTPFEVLLELMQRSLAWPARAAEYGPRAVPPRPRLA